MLILASSLSAVHPLALSPFILLLGMIALMPFVNRHWWEHHYPKVAVVLGLISVIYYGLALNNWTRVLHTAHEYVSFIALIGSLFVVAGGIHIVVKGEATPFRNCVYLLIGAILANFIGTTGASMLLIRPWIRTNRYRITTFHIVFFIFIVSNVGGCLTPIGDPPLFLGYLKGVPFWWVLEHCWEAWLISLFGLLAIFYCFDRHNFLRAPKEVREMETASEEWKIGGLHNLLFLGVILVAVFISQPLFLREALMIGAAVASYYLTPNYVHRANDFTFAPIKEVGWLFIGIFATMMPALDYLSVHAQQGNIPLHSEMQYYWLTGMLSGILDNAPTYLTFLAASLGTFGLSMEKPNDVMTYITQHDHHLVAISLGAVFFGAMTYIGNGPNFMVKSIAEAAEVKVPSFFGYFLKYSVPILLPILLIISLIFFYFRFF
ncbi:MAG: sodium:proton antiporter [Verrucomicrobiia bacterium]